MRILALDYGTARIGCAVSDPTGTIVKPLAVIEPPDPRWVARLAETVDAELVLVGLPLSLSGADSEQTTLTREFCEKLATMTELQVDTYDERLTTRMAQSSRRGGASADEDSLAAAHLLEGYLESLRASAEVVDDA